MLRVGTQICYEVLNFFVVVAGGVSLSFWSFLFYIPSVSLLTAISVASMLDRFRVAVISFASVHFGAVPPIRFVRMKNNVSL